MKIFTKQIALQERDREIIDAHFDLKFEHYFLDIETTGLHREKDQIILIGVMKIRENHLEIKQYLSEKKSDERRILANFIGSLSPHSHIITFNGLNFDLPFLNQKLQSYDLEEVGQYHIYSDIYRWVKTLKFEDIKDLKLKSVCEFFKINRVDDDGCKEIRSYEQYMQSKDERILDQLLLHNFEDVHNLFYLFRVSEYMDLSKHRALVPICARHSSDKFLYQANMEESRMKIVGILPVKNRKKVDYINYLGTLLQLHDGFFSMSLNIERVIHSGREIFLVNILDLKEDLNVEIPTEFAIIKMDGEYVLENIERIIEILLQNE